MLSNPEANSANPRSRCPEPTPFHQTRALGNAISRWLPRQQIVWGLRKPPCVVARGISWALSVRVFGLELLIGQPAGTILIYKPAGTIYKLAGIIYKLGWTRLQACTATRGPESSKLARTYDRPDVFIILLAVLPQSKMCTSLALSGFPNLSFAAPQWPEHLLEPMPNYLDHDSTTWDLGTLQSSLFCREYQPRCEALIKSCMLHSRYQLLHTHQRAVTDAGRLQVK